MKRWLTDQDYRKELHGKHGTSYHPTKWTVVYHSTSSSYDPATILVKDRVQATVIADLLTVWDAICEQFPAARGHAPRDILRYELVSDGSPPVDAAVGQCGLREDDTSSNSTRQEAVDQLRPRRNSKPRQSRRRTSSGPKRSKK